MTLKTRYIVKASLVTAGWTIILIDPWYWHLGLFVSSNEIWFGGEEMHRPIRLRLPKWDALGFVKGMAKAACLISFMVLFSFLVVSISPEAREALVSTWYFPVFVCLLHLAFLWDRYGDDYRKAMVARREEDENPGALAAE